MEKEMQEKNFGSQAHPAHRASRRPATASRRMRGIGAAALVALAVLMALPASAGAASRHSGTVAVADHQVSGQFGVPGPVRPPQTGCCA
jgi:hypothetical protein